MKVCLLVFGQLWDVANLPRIMGTPITRNPQAFKRLPFPLTLAELADLCVRNTVRLHRIVLKMGSVCK